MLFGEEVYNESFFMSFSLLPWLIIMLSCFLNPRYALFEVNLLVKILSLKKLPLKSSVHCTPYLHEINFNTLLLSMSRSLWGILTSFLFSYPIGATCIAYLLDLFMCLARRTNYQASHYTDISSPFSFLFSRSDILRTLFPRTFVCVLGSEKRTFGRLWHSVSD
jgi:hypothetical protein